MARSTAAFVAPILVACGGLLAACGGQRQPQLARELVAAVDSVGLVCAESFDDTVRSPADLRELEEFLRGNESIFALEGIDSLLLENHPFLMATDSATSFSVVIYHDRSRVRGVMVSAPVVNGMEDQARLMIETLYAVAAHLEPGDSTIRSWVEQAWRTSWKNYYREGITQEDVVKRRRIGGFTVAVWGVPPDLVRLEAMAAPE